MLGIPYTTFPDIEIGPFTLRVFGICVALGTVLGVLVAGRYGRRHNLDTGELQSMALWLVLTGVIGARITYVITNYDEVGSFWNAFAIWQGGLQFTGGAILAVLVALPLVRHWAPLKRWRFADAAALGLILGQAIGRLGCIAVGEHFGGATTFPLAMRWLGGRALEPVPVEVGGLFHNTSAYEMAHLLVLFVALVLVLRRSDPPPGVLIGVFALWYGVFRFGTDFLRVNDEELFGLTGAQYGCLLLIAVGAWVLATTRSRTARLLAGPAVEDPDSDDAHGTTPDVDDADHTDRGDGDDDPNGDAGAPGGNAPDTRRPVTTDP